MKKRIFFLLLSAFAINNFAQQPDHVKTAEEILDYLNKKEFGKIIPWFDSSVASKLDASRLEQVWNGLLQQVGAFKKSSVPVSSKMGSIEIIDQLCEFEKTSLNFRIGFNQQKKINSFLFLPPSSPVKEYKEPSYSVKDKFEEKEITVKTGTYELPGTLSLPKNDKKFPLVILVHGSGPNDRDESLGGVKVFKDIACGLASNGIGVLRYEKRSRVYGAKISDNPDSVTVKEEVIDDVISAFHLARTIAGADTTKIFILGHSLGAMLAPRIAARTEGLHGIIMMAANARPLEDLYLDQMNYLLTIDGDFSKEDRQKLSEIKLQCLRVKKLGTIPAPQASELPLGVNACYWRDLKNYHQVETAKELKLPMLIMQGERDYQVTIEEYNLWQTGLSGKRNVRFRSFPKLNHVFTEGEGKSKPEEYMIQANVPEYVIKEIVNFVKK